MSRTAALQGFRSSARPQRRLSISMRLLLAIVLIVFSVFPMLWVLSASLSPAGSLATQTLVPKNAGLGNYQQLLSSVQFPFWTWFGNSIRSPRSPPCSPFPSRPMASLCWRECC